MPTHGAERPVWHLGDFPFPRADWPMGECVTLAYEYHGNAVFEYGD